MTPHPSLRVLTGLGAALAGAQYLPSVVTLGQWTPLRAAPFGWCRWAGPERAQVAITFDDGPHPRATPAVLDALDDLGLAATFFVLGQEARRYPEVVAEVQARGHQVETHGHAHRHHLARTPRWVLRDLQEAQATMEELGVHPTWYRPAYGQATGFTLAAARSLGLAPVLWSAWGREWTTEDPGEVAGRIGRRLGPGAIILLHDSDAYGTPGMWRVGLAALSLVAADLERRSLKAVTLGDMVGAA